MPSDRQASYEFGQFTLIPTEKRLLCDGNVVPLAPKVFDMLALLVANPGRLVHKEELLSALWPDTVVEEVALAHNVSQLRKVLGDRTEEPRFIETVPKRGYRFIARVQVVGEPATGSASETPGSVVPAPRPPGRFRRIIAPAIGVLLGLVAATGAYLYLARAGHGAGAFPAIHSLVVLPLENLSGDADQDYFADGVNDALTTDLAQIGSLRIISRTSAMHFKGSRETLPQIGRALNVDAAVEGTVARINGRVRITAQLIDARSDRHLWARSYERDAKDVLALQDEIALDIAEQIRIKLTSRELSLLAQAHVVDPETHDLYLRGRYWWSKRNAEGEWKGLDYFQKAVGRDPRYALAYAGVADSFVVLGHHSRLPPREALPKAEEAALKALELDPSLAEAHTSLAIVRFSNDYDWSGAEREFRQAIALNPNYATAHHWYSHYLVAMGRLDEAVSELERARDLDPFSVPINAFLGMTLYYARRYDDALRQYRRALEMHPDRVEFYEGIADVYEQKRMYDESVAMRMQALGMLKDPTASALEQAYKSSGYRGYLQKKIEVLAHAPTNNLFAVLLVAHLYAALDDAAHAVPYLERAYDDRNPWLLNVRVDPAMDSIRSTAAFQDLIRRIGLPRS